MTDVGSWWGVWFGRGVAFVLTSSAVISQVVGNVRGADALALRAGGRWQSAGTDRQPYYLESISQRAERCRPAAVCHSATSAARGGGGHIYSIFTC